MVQRPPIEHHNDELKTQSRKIILRYPLSSSGVPRARHLGQKISDKHYPTEIRSRKVRSIPPPRDPKYLPYQSSKTPVSSIIKIVGRRFASILTFLTPNWQDIFVFNLDIKHAT